MLVDTKVGNNLFFPCNVLRSAGVRRYDGGHTLFSVCFSFSRCSSIRRWAHFIFHVNVFHSAGVRQHEGGHNLFSICFWFSQCLSI